MYISAFKREVNNIVSSNAQGKDLEESMRLLYRKYVRGESVSDKMTKSSDEVNRKVQALLSDRGTNTSSKTAGRVPLKESSSSSGTGQMYNSSSGGFTGNSMDAKMEKAFIRDVEAELLETAKEADRQKVSLTITITITLPLN